MNAAAPRLGILHRRLAAGMGLAALAAFISGAGLDTPSPLIAVFALLLALVWAPGPRLQRVIDPAWRVLALVLTARALFRIFTSPEDVVLPMVDLLLVLLVSENLKETGAAGDSRVYSLSFALLVAACAYRPGVVFAISFIAYAALGTVTLMVGHLIRKLSQHQVRDVRLDRSFLFRIAAMSGVLLALSAVVFAAFPRVSRGWAMRGATATASVVGFGDRVSLAEHGGRIYPNPEVVLRVEFPEGPPTNPRGLYWRGRSYDFFDGVAWDRSPAIPVATPPASLYVARWPRTRAQQRIYAVPLDIPVLFGLHPVLNIRPQARMRAMQDNVGDLWYFGSGSPTYDVSSAADPPPADDLRSAPPPTLAAARFYLQVPTLPRRVRALADSLTVGAATQYDKVIAVQNYLRSQFSYTLELPASSREATLEHFLFRRRAGHCEYFSTALAVLLREVGIPARNVNGFLGGTWNEFGQFLTVTQNEAHSWVEVHFSGYGWVAFDATPVASAVAARQQFTWFMPLRTMLDGVEHRWNKWILEYNLETQVSLFQRVTEPFASREAGGGIRWNPSITKVLKALLATVIFVLVVAVLFRRTGSQNLPAEARIYLQLRRAYVRAGYPIGGNEPPLQFVKKLESANAPGIADTQMVVELYLRSRFGGHDIGERGVREMRSGVAKVTSALRRLKQRGQI